MDVLVFGTSSVSLVRLRLLMIVLANETRIERQMRIAVR
jgi:hypothetical protein